MNISKTDKPSRKLEVTGISIIPPLGAAINPRIPANWVKLEIFPRAPESDIMEIGFFGSKLSTNCC